MVEAPESDLQRSKLTSPQLRSANTALGAITPSIATSSTNSNGLHEVSKTWNHNVFFNYDEVAHFKRVTKRLHAVPKLHVPNPLPATSNTMLVTQFPIYHNPKLRVW